MNFRTFKLKFKKHEEYEYNEESIYNLAKMQGGSSFKVYEKNHLPSKKESDIINGYNTDRKIIMGQSILKKIKEDTPEYMFDKEEIEGRIQRIMQYLPYECYLNIAEWINNNTITDISYCDLSIKQILQEINWTKSKDIIKENIQFLIALETMSEYIEDEYLSKEKILKRVYMRTHIM